MFQSRKPELVSYVPGILTPTTVRMPQLDNPWDTIVLRDEGGKMLVWEGELTGGGVICPRRLKTGCDNCRAVCSTPPFSYD